MRKTPRLRFKEFSGEWEKKKLKEICSLITKGTTPNKFNNIGINFIKIEGLKENSIDVNKCLYIDEQTHKKELKRSILEENDILFAIAGATIGKCGVVTKNVLPANTNQALSILRLKPNYNCHFVLNALKSVIMQKYISLNISVGAQPNLNLEQMGNFQFMVPILEEQQKISNFFSLMDKKTEKQQEKVEALKDYKKGMMQKIFSQKIRFKDENGEEYPVWKEKKLGEVIYEPKKEKVQQSFKEQLLTVKLHCKGVEPTGNYPNKTEKGRPYFKRFKGELLIGRQNFHNGGIGIVNGNCNGLIASNAISSYINKEETNLYFIYYQLSQSNFYKRIDLLIGGTGQKEISKSQLEKLNILIPTKEEQNKIVNFLDKIDIKLQKEQQKLDLLKSLKKGLLQEMLV